MWRAKVKPSQCITRTAYHGTIRRYEFKWYRFLRRISVAMSCFLSLTLLNGLLSFRVGETDRFSRRRRTNTL